MHYSLSLAITVCIVLFAINILPILLLPISLIWHPTYTDPLLALTVWNVFAMYLAYFVGLLIANYSPRYVWSYPLGMLITIGLFAKTASGAPGKNVLELGSAPATGPAGIKRKAVAPAAGKAAKKVA